MIAPGIETEAGDEETEDVAGRNERKKQKQNINKMG